MTELNIALQARDRSLAQVAGKHFSQFNYTHQGIAEAFADFAGSSVRYVVDEERWASFNGKCWEFDAGKTVLAMLWERFIADRVTRLPGLTGKELDAELELALAINSSPRFRNDVFELLKPKLPIRRASFNCNANHWLVTPEYTYDLRTGQYYQHNPELLLTQCTAVAPDFGMPCPQFQNLLLKLSADDPETACWLWRFLGYSLTGEVREDVVLYLRGPGGNGKSTLIKTLQKILGAYAVKINIDALSANRDFHPTELAVVRDRRMVYTSEIEKGMRLRVSELRKARKSEQAELTG
jgi:putative DNA primase/helicase